MLLGAIVDAGLPLEELARPLRSLGVPGWRLRVGGKRDPRVGGTKVDVLLGAGHDHHQRGLDHILTILKGADGLPDVVRARADEVFRVLAEAESQVHGVPIDEIHFHEVGAVDAIVDVAGVCLGFHLLGVDSLSCAPLPLGSGTVKCAHGTLPVPAPATALLLRGLPTVPGEGKHPTGELVTPTGAALVRVLCDSFGASPPMRLDRVAWGLGGRDRGPIPNAVRFLLGTREDSEVQEVDVLTATIDDMDARLFGPLASRLLDDGALDVTLCPVYGKKGRPAVEVTALSPPDRDVRARLEARVFSESTTLGLRWRRERRATLERRFVTVETAYGPVAVKQGLRDGEVVTSQPEFDSCLAASEAHDVPVRRVIESALGLIHGDDCWTVESDSTGPVE
jgi:pyridinium-3,5-bisthiocarboxylic acid mononucleotide nickel chelatase